MFDRSRLRLTLGYVGVLALILLLFSAVVVIGFRISVAKLQDHHLLTEAENRQAIVSGGGTVYGGGSDEFGWSVVDPDGRPLGQTSAGAEFGLPRSDLARLATQERKRKYHTVEEGGDATRIVSLPVWRAGKVAAVVQVAQSRAVIDQRTEEFVRTLVPVGLVALALAAVGGHFISGRAMRPIRFAFDKQRAFVADASHELKTPLTLIRADAEMVLFRGRLNRDDRTLVEHALAETDRMDSILSDLLLVARLDAGKLEVAEKPFDLALVLSEEAERFGARAAAKGVRLEVRVPGELPARGDPKRTGQILAVLLDNAVRFAPPGGSIDVCGLLVDGRTEATVADTGPGVPQEQLERVFDRFYRAEASRGRGKGAGTGLGLAIARDLARAQGGDLVADGATEGARFRLLLPKANALA
jgi:signal transduction histidine kinase